MKVLLVIALLVCAAGAKPSGPLQLSLPTGRVVGGQDASPHAAPYIVSLQTYSHFCAGSIIDANTILTAAHCIKAVSCSSITVVAGLHDLKNSKGSQSRRATSCKVHKDYKGGVGPFDIGTIHLSEPFDLTDKNVQAIELPSKDEIHSGFVTLYGWGSTSSSVFPQYPDILQTVKKPIIEYSKCEEVLGGPGASPLHPSNICTGPLTGGISACSGDSGGPLVQGDSDKVVLVGIVSWGYIPCGSKDAPSVYTRTSAYIDWIKENQKKFMILQ